MKNRNLSDKWLKMTQVLHDELVSISQEKSKIWAIKRLRQSPSVDGFSKEYTISLRVAKNTIDLILNNIDLRNSKNIEFSEGNVYIFINQKDEDYSDLTLLYTSSKAVH